MAGARERQSTLPVLAEERGGALLENGAFSTLNFYLKGFIEKKEVSEAFLVGKQLPSSFSERM